MVRLKADMKAAEERFVRDLMNENNQLHKELRKMCDLMSERNKAEFADMEVRHGTVVFLGCHG